MDVSILGLHFLDKVLGWVYKLGPSEGGLSAYNIFSVEKKDITWPIAIKMG